MVQLTVVVSAFEFTFESFQFEWEFFFLLPHVVPLFSIQERKSLKKVLLQQFSFPFFLSFLLFHVSRNLFYSSYIFARLMLVCAQSVFTLTMSILCDNFVVSFHSFFFFYLCKHFTFIFFFLLCIAHFRVNCTLDSLGLRPR